MYFSEIPFVWTFNFHFFIRFFGRRLVECFDWDYIAFVEIDLYCLSQKDLKSIRAKVFLVDATIVHHFGSLNIHFD